MIKSSVSGGAVNVRAEEATKSTPTSTYDSISRWRPDVYVQSFVPEAFKAINECPATTITTPPVDGIDFEKYVDAFYGERFRRPLPISSLPNGDILNISFPTQRPNIQEYGQYFFNCITLDNSAHEREIRSFDMFGAKLGILDPARTIFILRVPGLREDSPMVQFGDKIILRQWLEQPSSSSQLGLYGWLPTSSSHPGFTGYEINAVIVGVDKIAEILHVRAFGLLNIPQILCNVIFTDQIRSIQRLQLAVYDVAIELQKFTTEEQRRSPSRNSSTPSFMEAKSQADEHTTTSFKNNWLRNMLFPKEEYGIIQDELPSAKFPQKWFDLALNYEQKKATNAVTTANYGRLCYLINGPPGTGKTKTICEMVAQLGKSSSLQGCILLCAPSNQAADTLAQRLSKQFPPTDMLRLNHFSRTFAEVPMDIMLYCFIEHNIFSIPPIDRLMRYRIIVTTCQDSDVLIQARVSNRDLFNLHRDMTTTLFPHQAPAPFSPALHWSALIVDEAAQATEPDTLIPLSVVAPPVDAPTEVAQPIFVMAGDHHQLGPRTYDKTTGIHVSLFERLSNEAVYAAHPLARKKMLNQTKTKRMLRPPFTNLTRNYRSHPAVLAVPSSLFYSNTLIPEAIETHISLSWHDWSRAKKGWPIQFVCNGGIDECENFQDSTHGWFNKSEALKAIRCAQDIYNTLGIPDQNEICIMSPFRAQVRLLRRIARECNLHGINIGPVEAFQGLESRIVIVCTTRARLRFLSHDRSKGLGVICEPKEFNVAITRAKEGLVVIGNPWVLATDPCWSALLKFCWRNGLYWKDPVSDTKMHDTQEGMVNDWKPEQTNEVGGGIDNGGLESALLFKERIQVEESNLRRQMLGRDEDEQWKSGVEAEEAIGALDSLTLCHEDEEVQGEESSNGTQS